LNASVENRRGNSEEPEWGLAERLVALRATSVVPPSDNDDEESQNSHMSHSSPDESSSLQESEKDGFVDVSMEVDHDQDAVVGSRRSNRVPKGKSTVRGRGGKNTVKK